MTNPLLKQLENGRFAHAMEYVKRSAIGIKRLNSNELGHLNNMLTGENTDPWRMEPVQIRLPSGRVHDFSVISNPIVRTRDILSLGHDMAGDGRYADAATYVYSQLVMGHFFRDANRRTAVLAIAWLLAENDRMVDAEALLNEGLGDLREKGELEKLKTFVSLQIQKLP